MMLKWQATLVGGLVVLAFASVTTDARAAHVGNPGDFDFYIPWGKDSALFFSNGRHMALGGDGLSGTAFVQLELGGDGSVTHLWSDLPYGSSYTVSGVPFHAKMKWMGTTGSVDVGAYSMSLSVSARVRFEPQVVGGAPCETGTFTISLVADDFGESHCPYRGYSTSTGMFCLKSVQSFTIPQLQASACNSNGNALNSYFGLGLNGGVMQIWDGVTSPVIMP